MVRCRTRFGVPGPVPAGGAGPAAGPSDGAAGASSQRPPGRVRASRFPDRPGPV